MKVCELDTPALLVDREIMMDNIRAMQNRANRKGVALRPHIKTHKTPAIALIQRDCGCKGIAVAKLGEAEVMADAGFDDIFIANEIVGDIKMKRLRKLAQSIKLSWGIDCPDHVEATEKVFASASVKAEVLVEIEVGERRSGIIEESDFLDLLDSIKKAPHVHLKGVFSHEGHCYNSPDLDTCRKEFIASQKRTLRFV